jgi:hypothetical protein
MPTDLHLIYLRQSFVFSIALVEQHCCHGRGTSNILKEGDNGVLIVIFSVTSFLLFRLVTILLLSVPSFPGKGVIFKLEISLN